MRRIVTALGVALALLVVVSPPQAVAASAPAPVTASTQRATAPVQDVPIASDCSNPIACAKTILLAPITAPLGLLGGAGGVIAGAATNDVATSITKWAADGAASLMTATIGFATTQSDPALVGESAPANGSNIGQSAPAARECSTCAATTGAYPRVPNWFSGPGGAYQLMAGLAASLLLVVFFLGVLMAVINGNAAVLGQVMARVPLAVFLTAMAVTGVTLAMWAVDQITNVFQQRLASDVGPVLAGVVSTFQSVTASGTVALFVAFVIAVLSVIVAAIVFLELVVRAAAIYLAVFFLPMALVWLVLPGSHRWAKRLGNLVLVAVVSKLVIIASLYLSIEVMKSIGTDPTKQGGLGVLFAGLALFLLAASAPLGLMSIVGHAEGSALSGMRRQATGAAKGAASIPGRGMRNASAFRSTFGPQQSLMVYGNAPAIRGGGLGLAGAARAGGGRAAAAGAGAAAGIGVAVAAVKKVADAPAATVKRVRALDAASRAASPGAVPAAGDGLLTPPPPMSRPKKNPGLANA